VSINAIHEFVTHFVKINKWSWYFV